MNSTPSPIPHPRHRWLVSRHPGAVAWLRRAGIQATHVEHLDPALVQAGDEVYGTLPLHLAAAICMQGARFFHLAIDLPADYRGQELGPEELERFGARLQEFDVRPVSAPLQLR